MQMSTASLIGSEDVSVKVLMCEEASQTQRPHWGLMVVARLRGPLRQSCAVESVGVSPHECDTQSKSKVFICFFCFFFKCKAYQIL